MMKYFLLLVCLSWCYGQGYAQAIPEKFVPKNKPRKAAAKPVVKTTTQKPEPKEVQNDEPEQVPEVPKRQPTRISTSGLESTFATSDDCVLEIDGRWLGTVTRDDPKTITLDFGQHKVLAQNKATKEIYSTVITVLRSNQVFNIMFQSSLIPEADLESARAIAAQPPAATDIRVNSNEVLEPVVPHYVDRSALLQTARELSSGMVSIKGGRFPKSTAKSSGKKKEDSVEVNSFLLGRYEVTQQQWQQVMGYNNSDNKNCNDCPVENVSWNEIADFLQKLNENSELRFRLPTDAEWEYAARMDVREYIDKRGGRKYGDNVAWNENNAQRKTHTVGTRIPHRSGAYDLMGNVAEWCLDGYDPKGNKTADNAGAKGTKKIVRGGNFMNANFVETEYLDPKEKRKTVGFRLVQY
jgi:formylglycine-generating enzyme required for sulfatase activity